MTRFTTLYSNGDYSIQKDNENNRYGVFKKGKGVWQKVSIWYLYYGNAENYYIRNCSAHNK